MKEFWFMDEIVTDGVGHLRTYGPRGQVKGGRWKSRIFNFGPLEPTPAHWSPYTSPDLCGIPSGLDYSGADAPAQSG